MHQDSSRVFRRTTEGGGSPRYRFCVSYTSVDLLLHAFSLLHTRSHVHTLLYRVLLVTAPTKDPSIFPQSRRKFSLRARLAYISHCTGCAFCVPGTIIASYIKSPYTHAIKPFFSRTPRRPTRSSLFLFVPHHTLRILGNVRALLLRASLRYALSTGGIHACRETISITCQADILTQDH